MAKRNILLIRTTKQSQRKIKQYLEIEGIRKPFSLLLPYIGRYWKAYLGLVLLLFVSIFSALFFTWFLQNISDAAVKGDLQRVRWLLILGICCTLLNSGMVYCNIYLSAIAIQKVKRDLKNDLFDHMLRLPTGFYGNNHSGILVSHLTNDIDNIEGAIGRNLLSILRLPLMAIAAFIYLVNINWQLSLLCVLLVPLSMASGAVLGKLLRKNSKIIHEYLGRIHSFLNDAFAGHLVIRSFTLEKSFYKKYEDQNNEMLLMELKLAKLRGWFSVGAGAAGSIAYLLSMGMGAFFVTKGILTVGALLAFVSLMQYLISPLAGIAGLWGGFQRSIAAVERIQKVMEEPVETKELPLFQSSRKLQYSILFQNITFSYDGKKTVLENFNLDVPIGKVIALVGPSGAGKSTLFNLIQGFYTPECGGIFFNHHLADFQSNSELRNYIAYVPQETYLFAGTIRDNIACGRLDSTDSDIVEAARNANVHDFILSLPNGYDAEIGERGVKLSGGQRQRIAIARALLKDAPILLLDEATSALDSKTEYLVQEALERLMKNRTTMVIAHRLSTVQNADLIVVMEQGRIVEQGQHSELISKNGLYAHLYRLQFEEKSKIGLIKVGNR